MFSNRNQPGIARLGASLTLGALALILTAGTAVADRASGISTSEDGSTVTIHGWGGEDRGYLGVRLEEDTDSEEGGARITQIVDDSPADEAGLRKGDVIVSFDGRTIRGPVALTERIHGTKGGDSVTVEVMRDGRRETFTVEMADRKSLWSGSGMTVISPEFTERLSEQMEQLGERFGSAFACEDDDCTLVAPQWNVCGEDEECEGPSFNYNYFFSGGRPVLGVQLVEITPELRSHLGSDEEIGVLVSKIVDNSPAEKAGMQVGDLIVSVAGEPISDTRDLRSALRDKTGESFSVDVIRKGRAQTLDVTIERPKRDRPTGPRAGVFYAPDSRNVRVVTPRLLSVPGTRYNVSVAPRPVAPLPPQPRAVPRPIAPERPVAPPRPPRPERRFPTTLNTV